MANEVRIDPTNPRTWWQAEMAKLHNAMPVTAQMHDHAMYLAGVSAREFYFNSDVSITITTAASAYYGLSTASGALDVYNIEAEALGQKMIYSDHAMPTPDFREPLISKPEDLDNLQIPDNWLDHGRVRLAFDIVKTNMEMAGLAGGLSFMGAGFYCAPFSLAVNMRSYPRLIRDMKKDPEFAHAIFTKLVDEILPSYLKAQKEYCGATMATGANAWAAFPDLTPALLDEWVVPYAMKLVQNCQEFGLIPVDIAAGDYCEEDMSKYSKDILFQLFDIMVKMMGGQPVLFLGMGRWQDYPLEDVAEYLKPYTEKGQRATVTAGINARLLRDGPIEDIVDNVKRFIDVLGRDHNLEIFLANISADTPPEHVHAAVSAVHTFGKQPLADDLDEVEFELPQRESFEEYVDRMSGGRGLLF